jgi:hypothetical protein
MEQGVFGSSTFRAVRSIAVAPVAAQRNICNSETATNSSVR